LDSRSRTGERVTLYQLVFIVFPGRAVDANN
jgi:hypothetical protein